MEIFLVQAIDDGKIITLDVCRDRDFADYIVECVVLNTERYWNLIRVRSREVQGLIREWCESFEIDFRTQVGFLMDLDRESIRDLCVYPNWYFENIKNREVLTEKFRTFYERYAEYAAELPPSPIHQIPPCPIWEYDYPPLVAGQITITQFTLQES